MVSLLLVRVSLRLRRNYPRARMGYEVAVLDHVALVVARLVEQPHEYVVWLRRIRDASDLQRRNDALWLRLV